MKSHNNATYYLLMQICTLLNVAFIGKNFFLYERITLFISFFRNTWTDYMLWTEYLVYLPYDLNMLQDKNFGKLAVKYILCNSFFQILQFMLYDIRLIEC